MKSTLKFLIEVNKLKEITRTGWKIWRIPNPETIADHIFRVCFLAFLLGKKKGLHLKIALQNALSHDLCETYAGDITPFFYYQNLDIKKAKDREILMKGIRLSQKDKRRRMGIKFKREKRALLKLVKLLKRGLKNEIFNRWLNYEKGHLPEGKFVKQIDWAENLIQSLEYLGPEGSGSGWWELADEKIHDPLLLNFLEIIQKKFYHQASVISHKEQVELENILDFTLKIGQLKRMPRLYWSIRGAKSPETVAGHIFTVAIMAWVLGRHKGLNQEKLLKMALCHEISAVYTGDTTPYDSLLLEKPKEKEEILKKAPRLSREQKKEIFFKDFQEEKKTIEMLTKKLSPALRKEIIQLWKEYRTKSSPEGNFLSQLNVLAVLLQGLLYEQKDKSFFSAPLWEWAFENIDHPACLELLGEMKKKFYAKSFYHKFGTSVRNFGKKFPRIFAKK